MSEEVTEYKPEPPHTTVEIAKIKRQLFILKEHAAVMNEEIKKLEEYIEAIPDDLQVPPKVDVKVIDVSEPTFQDPIDEWLNEDT
jgi:hypothetical protein